jgi:hypothetical protein
MICYVRKYRDHDDESMNNYKILVDIENGAYEIINWLFSMRGTYEFAPYWKNEESCFAK